MVRQSGVKDFKFNINTGKGSAAFKAGDKVNLKSIRKATKSSGFKLVSLELEVTGAIQRAKGPGGEDAFRVHLESADQDIFLGLGKSKEMRSNYTSVQSYAGKKTLLTVRGPAHEHKEAGPGMTITKYEVVSNKADGKR